ncbi:hypothetical protein F2Q70_00001948 [Brassica cretica]|uniref:Uncharacterized protein n=1 Tax=Brassica cretica TaxID=69181 RepID=A0A8S9IKC1_BRACR|nr:hypothetical protein F2Q70_00001948 [Brassica cretica]
MGLGSREISSEQQFHVDFCRVRLLTTGRRGAFCEGAIEAERKHKGEEELSLSLKIRKGFHSVIAPQQSFERLHLFRSISEKSAFPGKNVVHEMDLMTDLLGKPSMDTISRVLIFLDIRSVKAVGKWVWWLRARESVLVLSSVLSSVRGLDSCRNGVLAKLERYHDLGPWFYCGINNSGLGGSSMMLSSVYVRPNWFRHHCLFESQGNFLLELFKELSSASAMAAALYWEKNQCAE